VNDMMQWFGEFDWRRTSKSI